MNMMWSNGKKKTPKQKSPLTIIEREFRWVFFCWCLGGSGWLCALPPNNPLMKLHLFLFKYAVQYLYRGPKPYVCSTPYKLYNVCTQYGGSFWFDIYSHISALRSIDIIERGGILRLLFKKPRFWSGDNHIRTWSIIYTPLLYICASQFYIPTHWYKNKIKILWKLIYLFFSVWSPLSGLSLAE